MRLLRLFLILNFSICFSSAAFAAEGAFATGHYRNLFQEYLGKTDAEIDARIQGAWQQLAAGDPDSQRLLYPVPGDMIYVPDIANNDVRTEGLSYVMMLTVQLDRQKEFNAIWKYVKSHMYYSAGPLRGYFAWHTAFDGRRLNAGPAPDGEEWFVMALFFASHRWQQSRASPPDEPIFDYEAEAQSLLHTMLHKHEEPGHGPISSMFDPEAKQILFVPDRPAERFSDPSYHLPAYTELWARWAAAPGDRALLAEITKISRDVFHRAAHPTTGLMPDYSNFDGTPRARFGHEDFRYDAWRTLSNPALDWSWWAADPWQIEQSNRVLTFLASHGAKVPDRYKIDGTAVSTDVNTPGLIAMAATAALAADRPIGEPWVRQLWAMPMPSGRHRYYDGLLTMIALLETSGHFRIYGPVADHK